MLNGKPLLIRGVNKHEHHPETGHTESLAQVEADIRLMKQHNFNAIRCSHIYINPVFMTFVTVWACTSLMRQTSRPTVSRP